MLVFSPPSIRQHQILPFSNFFNQPQLPHLVFRHRYLNFANLSSSLEIEEIPINNNSDPETLNLATDSPTDSKHFKSPGLDLKELEELPEQWRRAKLAWLCKELPIQPTATILRLLRAQKKWMRQPDATYIVAHSLRVRQNESAFKVYRWMTQQNWYAFDFALATKIADQIGKEGKSSKCREIFDDIVSAGRVPCESTFHILILAYLTAQEDDHIENACTIYQRMIHLGGYVPHITLHNSLFKTLISKPASISKRYIEEAECIYLNLKSSSLEVNKEVYFGLIWLHSYQESVNRERIKDIREEMKGEGIQESRSVIMSVLRGCSKNGDLEEVEKAWVDLAKFENFPQQAFVYKMEAYAKAGNFQKSLEIFEGIRQKQQIAYQKIIEILSKAEETYLAEMLMNEFIESGLTPLLPSFFDMMNMYSRLDLHEKVCSMFIEACRMSPPNSSIYSIYLDSLVKIGDISKAEKIFVDMYSTENIGVCSRSCNAILNAFLTSGEHAKAEKLFDLMRQRDLEIDSSNEEKFEMNLALNNKNKPKLTLSKDQREALVGMMLGGAQIRSDDLGKTHYVHLEINEGSEAKEVLRKRLRGKFREWLDPKSADEEGFCTVANRCFGMYAGEGGKLIHRWLSAEAVAYWFMCGGGRTEAGDVMLRWRGSGEGVDKLVEAFADRSLPCRVKRKGKVYWIAFFGTDAARFCEYIEPYVFHDLKAWSF